MAIHLVMAYSDRRYWTDLFRHCVIPTVLLTLYPAVLGLDVPLTPTQDRTVESTMMAFMPSPLPMLRLL